jgi:hypothetical protein
MQPVASECVYASITGEVGKFYLKPGTFVDDDHWQSILPRVGSVDGIVDCLVSSDLKMLQVIAQHPSVWRREVTAEDSVVRSLPCFIIHLIEQPQRLSEMEHALGLEMEVA